MIQRWMCWVYAIALVRIKIGCLIDVEKISSLCVCVAMLGFTLL